MGGSCSHIIGLIQALQQWQLMGFTSIPAELSSTSMPQSWNVPRGRKIDPEPVSSLRFVNPKLGRKRAPVQNQIKECRKIRVQAEDIQFLQSMDNCAMSYLVSNQPLKVNTHLGQVPVGSGLASQAQFYLTKEVSPVSTVCGDLKFPKVAQVNFNNQDTSTISETEAWQLEENTQNQTECPLWFQERKKRLTASQFGLILKRKKITESFIEMLVNPRQFTSAPTSYGTSNEKKAISSYISKTGNHTHKCGLLVNSKFPFLGASPDGKVCVDGKCGLLEVKCPFRARDSTILEACELNDFCLQEENGHISLKRNHNYFYQVQGQMFVGGAEFSDFVVFTRKDVHIERIHFNRDFCQEMIEKLFSFYMKHVIPTTLSSNSSR